MSVVSWVVMVCGRDRNVFEEQCPLRLDLEKLKDGGYKKNGKEELRVMFCVTNEESHSFLFARQGMCSQIQSH